MMKKKGKRWLAFLLVAALTWNEVFAMNVHASEVSITDEINVEDQTVSETSEEDILQEDAPEIIIPENVQEVEEVEIPSEEVEEVEAAEDLLEAATIDSVYGPYKNIYVPTGVCSDSEKLNKIKAAIPKEVYVSLSDGSTKTVAVTGWDVEMVNASEATFSTSIDTTQLSGITADGTKRVSITCAYSASCKSFTAAFTPTQVKPGESYKLKTTADGTRNVRLGYQLSTDSSGAVSAVLRYDSRTTAHTVLDNLSDTYNISSASVSDTGEYLFLCFSSSQDVSARNAYVMSDTASIEVRSSGNITKVTGFAQKMYVSSGMATTDKLTKIAAVLPQKACIVTDLGDTMDVATTGVWTYNETSGAFENKVASSSLPSGVTDSNNLVGTTTISMPYATNNDTSNITVTASKPSVTAGESTYLYIYRYKTSYAGTWLCKLPDEKSSGTVYDTSSSEYDQSMSDTTYAYFQLTNLQTTDAGDYCGIVADTTSAATSRYAYVSGTMASLTVTGGTSCSHDKLTSAFKWSSDHTSCSYTLTCSDCSEVVKSGTITATKKPTAATCSEPGSIVYTASVTYNGTTYSATPYTETIPVVAHTPKESFSWSTDHETCNYSITCSVCGKTLASGAATVKKEITQATCTKKGSIVYTANAVYNGKTYNETYTEILPLSDHTPSVAFTWDEKEKTCTYKVTCSVCGEELESGTANVKEDTEQRIAATCSQTGKAVYIASVTYGDKPYSNTYTETLPLIAHTPEASFDWNKEAKTCSYVITCSECNKELDKGAATVTDETNPASCSQEGSIIYTASVSYENQTYKDTYTKTLPTIAHKPVVSPLEWSTDHETCSYTVTCSECNQKIDQGVVDAVKTTTAATCKKEGSILYNASVKYNGQTYEATPYTEVIPKLSHKPVITAEKWSSDHSSCTITLGCSVCNNTIASDTVTSKQSVKAATCVKIGSITYTASLKYDGIDYSVEPYVEPIAKIEHNYVYGDAADPTYRTAGHTAGSACSVCGQAQSEENTIPSKAFTVKYDGNGNTSGIMAAQTDLHYSVGGNLTKCAYTKTTYEFTGWNSKADGTGASFEDGADIHDVDLIQLVEDNDGSVTLYAQWKRVQCSVTYELNGGVNAADNKTSYRLSDLPVTLSNPTKTGYVFSGWYTDGNYSNQITDITDVESDLTLYAKWTEKTYRIEFIGNNATSGYMTNQATSYTDSSNLYANAFERAGYIFTGWNSKSDGSGAAFTDQAAVASVISNVEAYGDDNIITLYAQWRRDVISIFYYLNGGTNDSSNPDELASEEITLKAASRSGYTFSGWYSDASFKNKVTAIANDNVDSILDADGHISLYAKWTANKYSLIFNGNYATSGTMSAVTGTYKEGAKIPANTFKRTGCYFYGWKGSDGNFYKNEADLAPLATSTTPKTITLTAYWKLYSYGITYNLNGGTNNVNNPATYTYNTETITLRYPKKRGYTFGGWYTDAGFKKRVTQIPKYSVGRKVFYAKWTPTKYKITYVLNGGTNNRYNPLTYTVTTNSFSFKTPTRKGYTFLGWYTDSTFKTRTYQVKKGSIGNKTVYAKWSLNRYKITYVLNGGINNSGNPTTYTVYTSTFSFKNPRRSGYRFAGWYTDKACTKRVYQIKKGSVGNRTVYAKWIKN